ncbi:MAG: lysophospholipid acyltransferase family protein, partial [Gemmatimonadota bacterium]
MERAIRACFPEFSDARGRTVAAASYRSIGRVMFESIYLSRATPAEVRAAFVGVEGREVLEAAYAQGKGVILAAGHIGNWELSGAWLGASGLPVDGITMHMANPLSDRFFARTRARHAAPIASRSIRAPLQNETQLSATPRTRGSP